MGYNLSLFDEFDGLPQRFWRDNNRRCHFVAWFTRDELLEDLNPST
jgi:hypothetical protein